MSLENVAIDTATGRLKVGGGGGGATDPLLFKWNETDLTQFTTRVDTFTGALSLSVTTDTLTGRNAIKAAVGASSTPAQYAFVAVNTADLLQGLTQLPLRYIVRMRTMYIDENMMVGPAYALNELAPSSFNGLGTCVYGHTSNMRCAVFDNSVLIENANTVGMNQAGKSSEAIHGCVYTGELLYAVGTPATPYCLMQSTPTWWNTSPSGAIVQPVSSGFGWIAPLSSNWNSYTPTTAGLFFRGSTATFGGVGEAVILSYEILRHPMDL